MYDFDLRGVERLEAGRLAEIAAAARTRPVDVLATHGSRPAARLMATFGASARQVFHGRGWRPELSPGAYVWRVNLTGAPAPAVPSDADHPAPALPAGAAGQAGPTTAAVGPCGCDREIQPTAPRRASVCDRCPFLALTETPAHAAA